MSMNTFETFSHAHFVLYPTNKLIGIIDTPDQMHEAITQLTAIGVPEHEIEVLAGSEEATTSFDVDGTKHGVLSRLWRRMQQISDVEQQEHRHYAQQAAQGLGVIAVHVPKADQRAQAIAILKENGGHYLHFYGMLAAEEIAP